MEVRPGDPGMLGKKILLNTKYTIEIQRFVQLAFSMANFFKKYFVRKNSRGGGELMICY